MQHTLLNLLLTLASARPLSTGWPADTANAFGFQSTETQISTLEYLDTVEVLSNLQVRVQNRVGQFAQVSFDTHSMTGEDNDTIAASNDGGPVASTHPAEAEVTAPSDHGAAVGEAAAVGSSESDGVSSSPEEDSSAAAGEIHNNRDDTGDDDDDDEDADHDDADADDDHVLDSSANSGAANKPAAAEVTALSDHGAAVGEAAAVGSSESDSVSSSPEEDSSAAAGEIHNGRDDTGDDDEDADHDDADDDHVLDSSANSGAANTPAAAEVTAPSDHGAAVGEAAAVGGSESHGVSSSPEEDSSAGAGEIHNGNDGIGDDDVLDSSANSGFANTPAAAEVTAPSDHGAAAGESVSVGSGESDGASSSPEEDSSTAVGEAHNGSDDIGDDEADVLDISAQHRVSQAPATKDATAPAGVVNNEGSVAGQTSVTDSNSDAGAASEPQARSADGEQGQAQSESEGIGTAEDNALATEANTLDADAAAAPIASHELPTDKANKNPQLPIDKANEEPPADEVNKDRYSAAYSDREEATEEATKQDRERVSKSSMNGIPTDANVTQGGKSMNASRLPEDLRHQNNATVSSDWRQEQPEYEQTEGDQVVSAWIWKLASFILTVALCTALVLAMKRVYGN